MCFAFYIMYHVIKKEITLFFKTDLKIEKHILAVEIWSGTSPKYRVVRPKKNTK
jgi:hypothetical protein